MQPPISSLKRLLPALLLAFTGGGCSITGGITDSLSSALLNNDDPQIVANALPTFLIVTDAMIERSPDDADVLLAGSKLYGAYAGSFVDEPERQQKLSLKARDYAQRALCEENQTLCAASKAGLDELEAALQDNGDHDLPAIHGYAAASAGWVQGNSSDWNAIAELPKIQAMMEHVIAHDEAFDDGSAHMYLGVLYSLRPAALGGKPDEAREHFERSVVLSNEQNLMAKVLFARQYARLVFDQQLHDRLLNEVIEANPTVDGYTLSNTLAQQQAATLLAESNDYF